MWWFRRNPYTPAGRRAPFSTAKAAAKIWAWFGVSSIVGLLFILGLFAWAIYLSYAEMRSLVERFVPEWQEARNKADVAHADAAAQQVHAKRALELEEEIPTLIRSIKDGQETGAVTIKKINDDVWEYRTLKQPTKVDSIALENMGERKRMLFYQSRLQTIQNQTEAIFTASQYNDPEKFTSALIVASLNTDIGYSEISAEINRLRRYAVYQNYNHLDVKQNNVRDALKAIDWIADDGTYDQIYPTITTAQDAIRDYYTATREALYILPMEVNEEDTLGTATANTFLTSLRAITNPSNAQLDPRSVPHQITAFLSKNIGQPIAMPRFFTALEQLRSTLMASLRGTLPPPQVLSSLPRNQRHVPGREVPVNLPHRTEPLGSEFAVR
jgi:hypothetical protein